MLTESRARIIIEIDDQIAALKEAAATSEPVAVYQWRIERLEAEREWLLSRSPAVEKQKPR